MKLDSSEIMGIQQALIEAGLLDKKAPNAASPLIARRMNGGGPRASRQIDASVFLASSCSHHYREEIQYASDLVVDALSWTSSSAIGLVSGNAAAISRSCPYCMWLRVWQRRLPGELRYKAVAPASLMRAKGRLRLTTVRSHR